MENKIDKIECWGDLWKKDLIVNGEKEKIPQDSLCNKNTLSCTSLPTA